MTEKTNVIRVRIVRAIYGGGFTWAAMHQGFWTPADYSQRAETRFGAAKRAMQYFGVYPHNKVVFVCQSGEGL